MMQRKALPIIDRSQRSLPMLAEDRIALYWRIRKAIGPSQSSNQSIEKKLADLFNRLAEFIMYLIPIYDSPDSIDRINYFFLNDQVT